jgi:hypothetical protein
LQQVCETKRNEKNYKDHERVIKRNEISVKRTKTKRTKKEKCVIVKKTSKHFSPEDVEISEKFLKIFSSTFKILTINPLNFQKLENH